MRRISKTGVLLVFCVAVLSAGAADVPGNAGNTVVTIQILYDEPDSMQNDSAIVIDGQSHGEFVEIWVDGTVYDFTLVSLKWDDDVQDLAEDEILHHYPAIDTAVVVIRTYLPEGIPIEKVTWKSASGDEYEYILAADGQHGEGALREFRLD